MSGRLCCPLSPLSFRMDKLVVSQLLRTRWHGGQVHGHPGLDRVPWTTRLDRHLHLCGHLDPGLAKSCHLSTQHPDHTPVPGDYKNCKISQRFSPQQTSVDHIHLQISHSCHLFAISSVPRFDAAQMDFRVKNSK